MFNGLFGKHDEKNHLTDAALSNGSGNHGSSERNESYKRLLGPQRIAPEQNGRKPGTASGLGTIAPPAFEQIYESAAVKPPKLGYGILKVAEMANSPHLSGVPAEFKRKALLMALEAAGTDVGDVLNDVVIRQRALKDYEEMLQEKVRLFEAAQLEQNRLHKEDLDKITGEHMARIQANLDEVSRAHDEFHTWQKSKQQELQRLTEAASLCVQQEKVEEEPESRIMAIPQKATGTFR